MIQIEDLKTTVKALDLQLKGIGDSLNIPKLTAELDELNQKQHKPDFWDDVKTAQQVSQRAKNIEDKIAGFDKLCKRLSDVSELLDICDGDESMIGETAVELASIETDVAEMHIATLLSGKFDSNNAILTLHAGAGGTEAQDWVQMLYRMYTRYAERRGYKVELIDMLVGEEAGIKSVTFQVSGANAYGYLKAEKGVHRLVRISPFDAQKRRHTSFASLEVMPELPVDNDIVIEDKDLKVDTYRSSGAGGQHVNKTESAIRITHLPTGIVVSCQTQRSQIQNREQAMQMLKSKLAELKEREQMEEALSIKGEIKKIEWGSQIRSYVFCPYTLVKDHRTNYENANIADV
ncbi:MAG: peptide chain release factor 2, partial [Corallococcus sp.]|nr:peptide chain release factor 2 [Corallococcus sp.]MCM1395022.1 peptide chain release factor 2 [Corallococcus sp.]